MGLGLHLSNAPIRAPVPRAPHLMVRVLAVGQQSYRLQRKESAVMASTNGENKPRIPRQLNKEKKYRFCSRARCVAFGGRVLDAIMRPRPHRSPPSRMRYGYMMRHFTLKHG